MKSFPDSPSDVTAVLMAPDTPLLAGRIGLLLFATVSLAAWPVSYAYDSSAEDMNMANIQRMGYHNMAVLQIPYEYYRQAV